MKTPAVPGAQPSLAALPQFLRYLGTFPPSQQVLEALVRGPLANLQARIAQLYRVEGGDLVSIGYVGPQQSVGDRHMVLPLEVAMPMTRAVAADLVLPVAIDEFRSELVMELDREVWDVTVERFPVHTIVNVPLTYAGQPVGALGFAMARAWDDDGLDPLIVEGLRGPLALWLTHPMAGLAEVPQAAREWSLSLSERQRTVLRQLKGGAPTSRIACDLGVSESTVKQDVLRAMKAMRTTDRAVAIQRAEALGLLDT